MNLELYIDLLEKEVMALRQRKDDEQREARMVTQRVNRAGGVAGIMGLSEAEMVAEKERHHEFNVPRGLTSEPSP